MLELKSSEYLFCIDNQSTSCNCWLVSAAGKTLLGEADFERIKSSILRSLTKEGAEIAGELDGMDVSFLCSFSPLRYAIYFAKTANGIIYFVQDDRIIDDNGGIIAKLTLTKQECMNWQTLLGSFN